MHFSRHLSRLTSKLLALASISSDDSIGNMLFVCLPCWSSSPLGVMMKLHSTWTTLSLSLMNFSIMKPSRFTCNWNKILMKFGYSAQVWRTYIWREFAWKHGNMIWFYQTLQLRPNSVDHVCLLLQCWNRHQLSCNQFDQMFDQILCIDEVFEMKNPSGSIQHIFVIAFIGIFNASLIHKRIKLKLKTKL